MIRVLDLGCHDGYVGTWVARKLGVDAVHLDGLELNEQAVEICRRRSTAYGIAGDYKIGLAEDAPNLFDPGSYDAVVAFELIEHVAEVDGFLTAAEAMLKPGGRIYLSTPDGTFGAGQNPHHLRVYRAVDMAELLRRRGTLDDVQVGPDGIICACYVPSDKPSRGEVAIYCGPGWKHWSPLDIETPGVGLGGSETAAVRVAESLQALGFSVTVYGEVEQGAFGQVVFRDYRVFDPLEPRAAVISSRTPGLFERPVNAALKLLWMHDTDYGPGLTEESAVHTDAIVVLSEWHRAHVLRLYPFLSDDKLVIASNGITPAYFSIPSFGDGPDRIKHRALFSSSPDRGLDFLLHIWPQVRFHVPDAELAYCYSDVYDAMAAARPDLKAFRMLLNEDSKQDGVVNLGSLSQPQLAREMMRAGAWLNPGWNGQHRVRFKETYCIGAVEAAAAGCKRVVSGWGALPERHFDDNLQLVVYPEPRLKEEDSVPPDPEQWVNAIVTALRADDHTPSREAMVITWDAVAEQFAGLIEAPVLAGR